MALPITTLSELFPSDTPESEPQTEGQIPEQEQIPVETLAGFNEPGLPKTPGVPQTSESVLVDKTQIPEEITSLITPDKPTTDADKIEEGFIREEEAAHNANPKS